jgi:hypothetical protein
VWLLPLWPKAGSPVAIVNPRRVSKFAGAIGETAQPAGGAGEIGSSRPRLTVR